MNQAQFEKEYHWLYGLDEYYDFTGEMGDWEIMRKALMNSNYYRIRDVVLRLMEDEHKIPEYLVRRGCLNVLFRNEMPDVVIKPQMVANLVDRYMINDRFISGICNFINYWGGEGDGAEAAVMPDLNDFLSRGQVKSKLWLVTELAKVVDGPIGNVVFYGGWYNFVAFFLFQQFNVDSIYSLDLDEDVIDPSKRLYKDEVEQHRFIPILADVGKVSWNNKKISVYDVDGEEHKFTANVVVNTSCEHMDNTWFDNLPEGTFVVLQTNDYFENEQHSNCCKDLEDAKAKYPMQNIFYEGELDTQLYNRFMLIGIK